MPLLTGSFPNSGLTVEDPNSTMLFFKSKMEEFSEGTSDKLKIFRE